jgi:hypothetical protein
MSVKTLQGEIRGGTIVLLDRRADLPDGTKVAVTPLEPQPGTGAALLAVMNSEPHLTREDVAELEAVIAAGKRPRAVINLFDENDKVGKST